MYRHILAVSLVACIDYNPRPEDNGPEHSRPPVEESPIQEDRIVQLQQPQVDVLFVVDNSCSMYEEQQLLGANFPRFMEYFEDSGLDFHIGVISTDMSNTAQHAGKLRRVGTTSYIDEDTENPSTVFSAMANMGTLGSYEEKGRAAAWTMVELKSDIDRNEGFIREDAALHMVFISDEEDQSGGNPISLGEFREWMRTKKFSPDMVTSHSVVGIPGQTCAAIDTAGTQYIEYANASGGVVFNLCEPDWDPLLDELGLRTSGLKREYFLTKIPVVEPDFTLEVRTRTVIEGATITRDFLACIEPDETPGCDVVYNGGRNSITFLEHLPDPLAEILVRYHIRERYIPVP